jgi:predicted nuclease of restriction endonuclease-like RecB superfamily
MLTADLSINYRRGKKVFPFLIKTDNTDYLRDADNLIKIFSEFIGQTRGDLERELEEYVGTGTDYKILRGLIKLLMDRCEFETSSVAEPSEIRQKVFLAARKFQPVFPDSDQRNEVLETVAKDLNTTAKIVEANLYADLPAQQHLISFETTGPRNLLDRYNLAQAQAILYKCVEMKIRVLPSTAENYRAIFGWIKHFGLIHSILGNAANGYEITLTGAASLFHRSQKYGIQMSVFLPALLLCGNWRMSAEISDKYGKTLFYELTSEQTDLISNRYDEPEYENPLFEKLKKDWGKGNLSWQLDENREVIDLGKTAFIPDFVLISPQNEKIFLDILGFWTPKSLQKRLDEFQAIGFGKFIIAAWSELRGSREEATFTSENVLFFKSSLKPFALEELAAKINNYR